MDFFVAGYFILGIIVVMATVFTVWEIRRKYILGTLQLRVLLVKLPQRPPAVSREEGLKEIHYTSQLLSALGSLNAPFVFEVAVHNSGEEIHFYVSVPDDAVDFTIRQIQGLWNDASVDKVEDYTIFNPYGASDGAFLKEKYNFVLPIRTFEETSIDTFSSILSNFARLEREGEGAALQIVTRPAPSGSKKVLTDFVYKLKKGAKLEDALRDNRAITLKDVQQALGGKKESIGNQPVLEEEVIKAVEQKLAKPLFAVTIRIVAASLNEQRAQELLQSLAGSFDQFQAPLRNDFVATRPRDQKHFVVQYAFRQFEPKHSMILGSDELVSIFHLPTSGTETPRVKWLKTKEAPPPSVLPVEGTLLGESSYRGARQPVFISDEDRRRHIYVVGQTGTGKSTLMTNLALSDIQRGRGVAVIDPHGDLIDAILSLVPPERMNDVIVFDPSDLNAPLGLNMLEYDARHPEQKTFIVNEMQGIFNKLFSQETMGPMFEQYMRNALLLLMEDMPNDPATLMDVPRVFTDAEYRKTKLSRCQNPVIKNFWEKEAAMAGGEAALQNMTPYITSKFNNFIANDYMRPIIGQSKSALQFREIMDNRKILLVNLSKGRIGDINAGLLGMIITGKLLMAALSRTDVPQEERKDFNVYIDEFQNFTTDSIATILSEARKYRLNICIAHQFIAQLEDKTREAVFGNVGSMIIFRVGAKDAEELIRQCEPVFTKNDLVNVDNFNAIVKLLVNGETVKPFNIKILPAPKGNPALVVDIKNRSRTKYAGQV